MSLKFNDATVLELLTSRVRVIAHYQLRGHSRDSALRVFRRLRCRGAITVRQVVIHPELSLDEPLFRWMPGQCAPLFERLAWRLQSRWNLMPKATYVASATVQGRYETGGSIGGRPLRRTEVAHDVHVTALFLKLQSEAPTKAQKWVHEDILREGGQLNGVIPDATIGTTCIEFGGSYRAAKLRTMHRLYATDGRDYEIW